MRANIIDTESVNEEYQSSIRGSCVACGVREDRADCALAEAHMVVGGTRLRPHLRC